MVALFLHLKEDLFKMIANSTPDVSYPQIRMASVPNNLFEVATMANHCRIEVEGVTVGNTANLMEAIGILMATYYVFNVAYPKDVEKSLTFIQKAMLVKHEECKHIPAVVALIAKMNTDV